jgi:hypothetical protein
MFLLRAGVGGPLVQGRIREITLKEVKKHNKRQECFISYTYMFNVQKLIDIAEHDFFFLLPIPESLDIVFEGTV